MLTRRQLGLAGLATLGGCALGRGGWPGARGLWSGHDRHDFTCDGRAATVVAPKLAAPGRPWLWRGEFFGAYPSVDLALLGRGFHVAYLACKDTFGSPATMAHWAAFYAQLTERHGLSRRPVLLGMSRGGLYVYAWAAAHPDRVGFIYGDAPVCDVRSWPGGKGKGKGSPRDWALFQEVFALTEAEAARWDRSPIDVLAPLRPRACRSCTSPATPTTSCRWRRTRSCSASVIARSADCSRWS